jgi:hypothetical protein
MRRRAWVWALGTLAVTLAVAGGIVWDVHRRAEAVIERHRKEAQELLDAFRARPATRPPFDGEGIEGNAWDVFRVVTAQLGSLSADEQDALDAEAMGVTIDEEALGGLFLKYESFFLKLREGLNRKVVDPDVVGRGLDSLADISGALATAKVMGAGVAHFHRMGRDGKALDLAGVGLGFSQDAGRRACAIGLSVRHVFEGIFTWNLRVLLESHGLSRGELDAFGRRLDALDASRPTPEEGWSSEEIYVRDLLSGGAWAAENTGDLRQQIGWRQVWSLKVARALALDQLLILFEDGRAVMGRPTHERSSAVDQLLEQWERRTPPIPFGASPRLLNALKNDVKGLQARAMLRMAVALARHEAEKGAFPAALQDLVPLYAASIPTDPANGKAFSYAAGKVWAAGPDGTDNGGAADPINPEEPGDGYDLVWTVGRRK